MNPRSRGNPNWGQHCPTNLPVVPTQFELKIKALGLQTREQMLRSNSLRAWVRDNWKRRYVPEALLMEWNLASEFELESLE
jgi:hypothetical protein